MENLAGMEKPTNATRRSFTEDQQIEYNYVIPSYVFTAEIPSDAHQSFPTLSKTNCRLYGVLLRVGAEPESNYDKSTAHVHCVCQ